MILFPSLYYPSPCPISPFNAGGRHPELLAKKKSVLLDRRRLAREVAQSSGGRCSADSFVLWRVDCTRSYDGNAGGRSRSEQSASTRLTVSN